MIMESWERRIYPVEKTLQLSTSRIELSDNLYGFGQLLEETTKYKVICGEAETPLDRIPQFCHPPLTASLLSTPQLIFRDHVHFCIQPALKLRGKII